MFSRIPVILCLFLFPSSVLWGEKTDFPASLSETSLVDAPDDDDPSDFLTDSFLFDSPRRPAPGKLLDRLPHAETQKEKGTPRLAEQLNDVGYYAYELDFGLETDQAGTFMVKGLTAVDDALTDVLLENQEKIPSPKEGLKHPDTFRIQDYVSENEMRQTRNRSLDLVTSEFQLEKSQSFSSGPPPENAPDSSVAATPEPSTFCIFSIGAFCLACFFRRKIRNSSTRTT